MADEPDGRETFTFDEQAANDRRVSVYSPQAPAFQRLVRRVVASGMHDVKDIDADRETEAVRVARQWAQGIGASLTATSFAYVTRFFEGTALLRVRATTAHDSYERLVPCVCSGNDHQNRRGGKDGLAPVDHLIRNPDALGLDREKLRAAGERDRAIAEFSRFYLERGNVEKQSVGGDPRKLKKLEDDFTPRLETTLVGLEGEVRRSAIIRAQYVFPSEEVTNPN